MAEKKGETNDKERVKTPQKKATQGSQKGSKGKSRNTKKKREITQHRPSNNTDISTAQTLLDKIAEQAAKEAIPKKPKSKPKPKSNVPKTTTKEAKKKLIESKRQKTLADKALAKAEEINKDTKDGLRLQSGAVRTRQKYTRKQRDSWVDMYYTEHMSVAAIAKRVNVPEQVVRNTMYLPEYRDIRIEFTAPGGQGLLDTMHKKLDAIEALTEMYLEEAQKPERVAKTSLPGLFTVWGILVDKQVKLTELEIKRQELELKRVEKREANAGPRQNQGLIFEFMKVIQEANTLPGNDNKEIVGR